MNEEIVTCRYCSQPIHIGKGIYLEGNFEQGQMGWFHNPMCKWHIQEQWKQVTMCQEGYENPLNCTCLENFR